MRPTLVTTNSPLSAASLSSLCAVLSETPLEAAYSTAVNPSGPYPRSFSSEDAWTELLSTGTPTTLPPSSTPKKTFPPCLLAKEQIDSYVSSPGWLPQRLNSVVMPSPWDRCRSKSARSKVPSPSYAKTNRLTQAALFYGAIGAHLANSVVMPSPWDRCRSKSARSKVPSPSYAKTNRLTQAALFYGAIGAHLARLARIWRGAIGAHLARLARIWRANPPSRTLQHNVPSTPIEVSFALRPPRGERPCPSLPRMLARLARIWRANPPSRTLQHNVPSTPIEVSFALRPPRGERPCPSLPRMHPKFSRKQDRPCHPHRDAYDRAIPNR